MAGSRLPSMLIVWCTHRNARPEGLVKALRCTAAKLSGWGAAHLVGMARKGREGLGAHGGGSGARGCAR
eukprot:5638833-Pyramimonas_sp.AAC.1